MPYIDYLCNDVSIKHYWFDVYLLITEKVILGGET